MYSWNVRALFGCVLFLGFRETSWQYSQVSRRTLGFKALTCSVASMRLPLYFKKRGCPDETRL